MTIRILTVEDDPNDRLVLEHAFQQTGTDVELDAVPDGETAQMRLSSMIEGKRALPDLVILDLRLPNMSGIDVLRWMKSTPPLDQLPVVILSAVAHPRDVDAAHELDVNIYLNKNDDLEGWQRMAQAMIAFIEAHREEPGAAIVTA